MGIGFSWTARAKEPETFWHTVQMVADEQGAPLEIAGNQAWITLGPLGGVLFVEMADDGTVSGDCTTTPAGAGLHKAAIDFVRLLAGRAVKDLTIDDETDYAQNGDFDDMRQAHFYAWLKTLVTLVQQTLAETMESIRLSWDIEQYAPEDIPRTVVTPLGRFDVDKMAALVEEAGIEALAQRFFVWDNVEKDALYHRNKALNGLWEHCYFRPSHRSELDKRINELILDELELAMQLDPTLPEPLEAYLEVCSLSNRAPHIPAQVPALESDFPIGYRKGLIWEHLGNLELCLPGSYQYHTEQQENGSTDHVWSDDTAGCWWRVTALNFAETPEDFSAYVFDNMNDIQTVTLDGQGSRLRMGCPDPVEEEDGIYHTIVAQILSDRQVTFITITFEQGEEKEQIMAQLKRTKVPKKADGVEEIASE